MNPALRGIEVSIVYSIWYGVRNVLVVLDIFFPKKFYCYVNSFSCINYGIKGFYINQDVPYESWERVVIN